MIIYRASDVVEMLYRSAKEDASGSVTGWAQLGGAWCAYYPNSRTHSWFLYPGGKANRRELEAWLKKRLGAT
jgi:hypothetical protein